MTIPPLAPNPLASWAFENRRSKHDATSGAFANQECPSDGRTYSKESLTIAKERTNASTARILLSEKFPLHESSRPP